MGPARHASRYLMLVVRGRGHLSALLEAIHTLECLYDFSLSSTWYGGCCASTCHDLLAALVLPAMERGHVPLAAPFPRCRHIQTFTRFDGLCLVVS